MWKAESQRDHCLPPGRGNPLGRFRVTAGVLLCALLLACGSNPLPETGGPGVSERPAVVRVGYSVADLDGTVDFFRNVLEFQLERSEALQEAPPRSGVRDRRGGRLAVLRLGREEVELTEYHPAGRAIPADSKSNDLWFQHVAIVVSDMDRAYQRLVSLGVRPVSVGGPQTLPAWNPAAGGIRAFYFEDPEGHVLEIIWYPEGKGQPRWQATQPLFLGIDHTAIAVSDTETSRDFYEGLLGFVKIGESLNYGPEQAALSAVHSARVEITGLAGQASPGIELLRYLEPGPGRRAPSDTRSEDLWHWEIEIAVRDPARVSAWATRNHALWSGSEALLIRDPDGHALRIVKEEP